MPLLHILKYRSFYIKTLLRRALVLLFRTSDKPMAFKLTSFIETHFLRRDTPLPYKCASAVEMCLRHRNVPPS